MCTQPADGVSGVRVVLSMVVREVHVSQLDNAARLPILGDRCFVVLCVTHLARTPLVAAVTSFFINVSHVDCWVKILGAHVLRW